MGVAGWFAVRAGLRPLRRVETTAAAIAAGDLSSLVPALAAPRTELGSLSASLNTVRIEAGDNARTEVEQSMRRFIADVSHELRTPWPASRASPSSTGWAACPRHPMWTPR